MRKHKWLASLLIFSLIGGLFVGAAPIVTAETAAVTASEAAVEDLGIPIQTAQTIDAAYGQEDGANVVYTTVTGSASSGEYATFNVIDVDNQKLLRSLTLTGVSNAWSHLVTPDGRVFIGASHKMFVYSPATKSLTDLGRPLAGTESIWSLTSDENGNVYGGIYSASVGGRVFRIDAQTLEITDLIGGPVDDGTAPGDDGKREDYVRSLAYYKGNIYAGTGSTNGRIWKIDPTTGERTRIELPGSPSDPIYNGMYDKMGAVYGLTAVDRYLFVFFNGPFTMHVFDMEAGQWTDAAFTNIRGMQAATGYNNGKLYTSKRDKQMWEIDVATFTERPVMPFDGSIRNSQWMNVANQPEFPNGAMVTISYDGRVVLYDPPNQLSKALPRVVSGQGINIQTIETGPDGKIYLSSYMGTEGSQYDPATSQFTNFPLGQSEGIGSVGDTLYFGLYPKAELFAWDTTTPLPTETGPAKIFEIGQEQDRPFVVTEGAGKLLIGTIPGYSAFGGALTIYDPEASAQSGQPEFEVFRNIVQDQSITGLLYKDGLIYGSTSIFGGLGDAPVGARAKLFVWDMATKQKLYEWEPELGGAASLPMISGLTLGPDGLIWASANGIVFAFDPDTRQVVKSRNIYPDVTNYGKWRPVHQRWGSDGLLYTDVGARLTVVDPETMGSTLMRDKVQLFTLDAQNRVYVVNATKVLRYPPAAKPAPPEEETPVEPGPYKSYLDIRNGGFEEVNADGSIPGWSIRSSAPDVSSFSASTEQKRSGERSLKLVDASTTVSSAMQSDPVKVKAGREYVTGVNVFLGSPPVNPATGQPFSSSRTSVLVRYYDAAGKEIAGAGSSSNIQAPSGQWIPVELASTAPAGAVSLRVVLICSVAWVTTAYYDEVSVHTIVDPSEVPVVAIEPEAADVAEGDDVHLSVKATEGARILIKEGDELLAEGMGAGETPVMIAVPAPAAGMHNYTATAIVPGVAASEPVQASTVTVHPYTELQLEAPEGLLQAGDAITVNAYAVYGPLKYDVTGETVFSSDSDEIIRIEGSTVTGLAKGTAVLSASYAGREAERSIVVTDYELVSVRIELPEYEISIHESIEASVYGRYENGIPGREVEKLLTEEVHVTAKPAQRVRIKGLTITGKSRGSAIITAEHAGKRAEVQLTVIPPGHGKHRDHVSSRQVAGISQIRPPG
ncbi:hypothetical protein [Paenibacillus abyssi]|uniref:BIG2 domain-containing protein n=1 Tax=Paenibacillus abyssi TaxID=1340531 RepID=A0A917D3F6_9BACL|nr:hypothetical protein [Paenibacillus abyssi]GGG08227.1 hypothetical protein GCM10010916_26390 [Paenibacillus abyssi]